MVLTPGVLQRERAKELGCTLVTQTSDLLWIMHRVRERSLSHYHLSQRVWLGRVTSIKYCAVFVWTVECGDRDSGVRNV